MYLVLRNRNSITEPWHDKLILLFTAFHPSRQHWEMETNKVENAKISTSTYIIVFIHFEID